MNSEFFTLSKSLYSQHLCLTLLCSKNLEGQDLASKNLTFYNCLMLKKIINRFQLNTFLIKSMKLIISILFVIAVLKINDISDWVTRLILFPLNQFFNFDLSGSCKSLNNSKCSRNTKGLIENVLYSNSLFRCLLAKKIIEILSQFCMGQPTLLHQVEFHSENCINYLTHFYNSRYSGQSKINLLKLLFDVQKLKITSWKNNKCNNKTMKKNRFKKRNVNQW